MEKMNKKQIRSILKRILLILCIITFGIAIYFTLVILLPLPGSLSRSLSYFLPQISGFLMILYIATTILMLKVMPKRKYKDIKYTTVIFLGFLLSFLNALPILAAPVSIQNAEKEFSNTYGDNWREDIPNSISSQFLPTQFNLYNYFLGTPHPDCNFETDIKYYEDENVSLYFDVYYPRYSRRNLAGNNSIIINIHGGSWQFGDKGIGNVPLLNKYLASQGYVVFDIQYGLLDAGGSSFIPTPEHTRHPNMTLAKMVFQIGFFTKEVADKYASQYGGNTNSVFIMGRSAGAHLTGVVGLGYNDPYFAGNFSEDLSIKGLVPIYPPNFANPYFTHEPLSRLIPGNTTTNPLAFRKFTPSTLVDEDDPPVIIYQGLNDQLVPYINSEAIQNSLENTGINCVVVTFPFATHASDLLIGNSFSQVWIYYLERFLYLSQ
jgi:acetyl esterase/lipase